MAITFRDASTEEWPTGSIGGAVHPGSPENADDEPARSIFTPSRLTNPKGGGSTAGRRGSASPRLGGRSTGHGRSSSSHDRKDPCTAGWSCYSARGENQRRGDCRGATESIPRSTSSRPAGARGGFAET